LERDVDSRLLLLIQLIRQKYLSTKKNYKPLDLARLTTFFTLDTISYIAFGKPFGFLEKDDDPYGYLQQLHLFLPAVIFFGVYPEIQAIMRLPLVQSALPNVTDATGLGRVMA
jgi:hypothetical protein